MQSAQAIAVSNSEIVKPAENTVNSVEGQVGGSWGVTISIYMDIWGISEQHGLYVATGVGQQGQKQCTDYAPIPCLLCARSI